MEYHNNDIIDIPIPSVTSELIQIPEGVESMPEHHYEDYDRLELICIPNTVQKIGEYAFRGCSSLQMVYIPEGVQTIGVGCFWNCFNMKILAEFILSKYFSISSLEFRIFLLHIVT